MDGIDKDSIENLMDLSRLRFTDEECVNLKLAVGTGQLTRNNNRKRK